MTTAVGFAAGAMCGSDRSTAKIGQPQHLLQDGMALMFQIAEGFGHGAVSSRIFCSVLTYIYARILAPKKAATQVLTFMSRTQGPGSVRRACICAVIIKNCAHDEKETDPFHYGFVGSPRRESGFGWRRPGDVGRLRDQTHRKEDPAPVPGQ